MEDNNNRPKQTHGTTQLAQNTQCFLEEIRPEDSTMGEASVSDQGSRIKGTGLGSMLATYPIKTLSAPRGVTKIAGAKAYAAKLAISPIATKDRHVSQTFQQ